MKVKVGPKKHDVDLSLKQLGDHYLEANPHKTSRELYDELEEMLRTNPDPDAIMDPYKNGLE